MSTRLTVLILVASKDPFQRQFRKVRYRKLVQPRFEPGTISKRQQLHPD